MDGYFSALLRLPPALREALGRLDAGFAAQITEIHLRSGRPVVLSAGPRQLPAAEAPGLSALTALAAPMPHAQLQECFYALCGHSVHSYQQQLRQGYFTLPGGHRVGVAGPVYWQDGQAAFQTITSLDLRIARQVAPALPVALRQALKAGGGLLIVGPPGSGKTTLLRAIAAELSALDKKVTVVDERGELAPCTGQGFAWPVPLHCEVLAGLPKAEAIRMATRALGPQVILCDELGGEQDAAALEQGLYSGIEFVASVHGNDAGVLAQRPQFAALARQKAFAAAAVLAGADTPGIIRQVCPLC